MRKFVLTLAAATAVLAATSLANRADAVTIGSQSGVLAAIEDLAPVAKVHCRPRWPHHFPTRWRRANGCPRYR